LYKENVSIREKKKKKKRAKLMRAELTPALVWNALIPIVALVSSWELTKIVNIVESVV
jgi:hypothetical protein